MLNTIVHGEDRDTPLIIAHGLYGSARNWGVIAKRLSNDRQVIAVDMRNHGESFHDPDHSYPALAQDLANVIEGIGGKADVLGHSMGGKAAMVLARTRPSLIDRLIVANIAPVAYSHSQLPYIAAMEAVDLSRVTRRSDADLQLVDAVPDAPLRAFLLQSLDMSGSTPRWRLNLSALRDQMPLIMSVPDIGDMFDRELTILRGEMSDYVKPPHDATLRAMFPKARIATLKGAGHWLHAEDPRGFEAAIRAILG